MSRLLFAAARGARIEPPQSYVYHLGYILGGVTQYTVYWKLLDDEDCRIHPDDEHLQYGPISTALREIGLTGTCEDTNIPYVRPALEREDGYWESTEEQRRVFCLILADSGL